MSASASRVLARAEAKAKLCIGSEAVSSSRRQPRTSASSSQKRSNGRADEAGGDSVGAAAWRRVSAAVAADISGIVSTAVTHPSIMETLLTAFG
jgi:hypothetical protein